MMRFSALPVVVLVALGSIEGCSSDENTGGAGTPDGSAGAAGSGGSSAGGSGGAATGGAATGGAATGGAATGGAGTGGLREAGTDARGPEQTGQSCKTANDCYPNVTHSSLSGAVECITKVPDGYCTHRCNTDADCCKVAGECATDLRQVCASFENTADKFCFLSCEQADVRLPGDAGTKLPDGGPAFSSASDFCHKEAGTGLDCRSTGGGGSNRRACLPVGGAPGDGGPPRRDAGPDAAPGDASSDGAAPKDAATRG